MVLYQQRTKVLIKKKGDDKQNYKRTNKKGDGKQNYKRTNQKNLLKKENLYYEGTTEKRFWNQRKQVPF